MINSAFLGQTGIFVWLEAIAAARGLPNGRHDRYPVNDVADPTQDARVALNQKVARFIQSSFRSVWSLDLLLLLKRDKGPRSRDDLVSVLRASDLVVSQALDSLVAAGLAAIDEEGRAIYTPNSDEVAKLVAETETLYVSRPDMVRRLIIAASTPGITAFADAFKLGRD